MASYRMLWYHSEQFLCTSYIPHVMISFWTVPLYIVHTTCYDIILNSSSVHRTYRMLWYHSEHFLCTSYIPRVMISFGTVPLYIIPCVMISFGTPCVASYFIIWNAIATTCVCYILFHAGAMGRYWRHARVEAATGRGNNSSNPWSRTIQTNGCQAPKRSSDVRSAGVLKDNDCKGTGYRVQHQLHRCTGVKCLTFLW